MDAVSLGRWLRSYISHETIGLIDRSILVAVVLRVENHLEKMGSKTDGYF